MSKRQHIESFIEVEFNGLSDPNMILVKCIYNPFEYFSYERCIEDYYNIINIRSYLNEFEETDYEVY